MDQRKDRKQIKLFINFRFKNEKQFIFQYTDSKFVASFEKINHHCNHHWLKYAYKKEVHHTLFLKKSFVISNQRLNIKVKNVENMVFEIQSKSEMFHILGFKYSVL